jgi:hypothetical protein
LAFLKAITGLKTSFHESFIGLVLSPELDTSVIPRHKAIEIPFYFRIPETQGQPLSVRSSSYFVLRQISPSNCTAFTPIAKYHRQV